MREKKIIQKIIMRKEMKVKKMMMMINIIEFILLNHFDHHIS